MLVKIIVYCMDGDEYHSKIKEVEPDTFDEIDDNLKKGIKTFDGFYIEQENGKIHFNVNNIVAVEVERVHDKEEHKNESKD